jgi:peptidoglycan hydrolase-like protein with peptidoglycan-binding domain
MPSMTSRRAFPRAISARGKRGKVGAGVAAAAATAGLLAAAAPASAALVEPNTLLALGSSGPAVTEVQDALKVPANGYYGWSTKDAVISFQRRDGLMVDGIVGPQTWGALFGVPARPAPAPAPAPAPTTTTTTSTATTSSSYSGGYSVPSSIVACESGGNYSAVNPSSGAGGAYQILPSTWRAYGGEGLPQNASPAEQNAIAAQIYATQGASAWSCR